MMGNRYALAVVLRVLCALFLSLLGAGPAARTPRADPGLPFAAVPSAVIHPIYTPVCCAIVGANYRIDMKDLPMLPTVDAVI